MASKIKAILKAFIARIIWIVAPPAVMKDKRFFSMWENKGYHVTPAHYYEPIPDTRELSGELWKHPSELKGLKINDNEILNLLAGFDSRYRQEYDEIPVRPAQSASQFYLQNASFKSVDAEILYCMIRDFKPRHIIEIGSGYTTYLAAQSIEVNKTEDSDYQCDLTAIEPYPNAVLKKGFPGLSTLIEKPVQSVSLSVFDALGKNDILFIDSSHVVRIGSDVVYEYLEILPRLNKGVLVHLHDIFLPLEYPKKWVYENNYFWSEQYLLHAFMLFNNTFEVLWAGSYINAKYPEKLEAAISSYQRNDTMPGSFWIRRVQ